MPMLQHRGIWLSAGETHLQGMLDASPLYAERGTYQLAKLDAAVNLLPPQRRRLALDIGAHVGLWSRVLAAKFRRVECFEPIPWHRAAWARNMAGEGNAFLHAEAASDHYGVVMLAPEVGNSGSTRIATDGTVPANAARLDDFAFAEVDFVKVDCEGHEEPALRGLTDTIARCQPVIIAEQKPGHAERAGLAPLGAVRFLVDLHGYAVRAMMGGDFILTPPASPSGT